MKSLFSALGRWLVCALFVLTTQQALAGPASPFSFSELQPDGSRVTLHVRGDEHFNWTEDTDGFTVVRDASGRHVYARLGANGFLEPTSFAVGKADPRAIGLTRRVLPSRAVRAQSRMSGASPLIGEGPSAPENVPPTGNVKNMVIMIRFSDHASRTLPSNADIDVLFNAVGGDAQLAPTGSVKDVYLENSYGQMTLDSTIFGWIDLPNTEAYYANGQSGDSTLWEALRDALDVVDGLVDFNQYDTDNDGFIDAIAFIHSGYGAEWGGTDSYGTSYTNRIWSHRWAIQQPAWTSDEGVQVADYHISPGVWDTSGSEIGRVGVISHETGHFFGLPDLYDTDGNGSGIGSYGMMANSWGFDGSQWYPPHFSPWSKVELGWLTPMTLSGSGAYTLAQAEFNAAAYRVDSGYPSGEYLLIENRQPVGFDTAMPQGGLVIWHIDEQAGYNVQGYPGQSGWPGNGNHYRVAVLQADGDYDLEKDTNRGDAGDVYHGGGVTEISSTTTPNTDAYQNGNIVVTGNTISLIGAAGASMGFNFGQPPAGPSIAVADHQTVYGNVSGTYSSTHTGNNVYQIVTETQSGGRPSRRHDRLEHIWRFTPASTDNQFNVSAYRTEGGDADSGFDFAWSSSASGPWTGMLTATKTSDDDGYQSYTLGAVPSTVYVRVTDNNRTSGQRSADSIRVDHMFFDEGVPSTDPPGPASSPSPGNNATGVSINEILSWSAGADATSHTVYFGTTIVPPLVSSQQPGTSYDPGLLNADTDYFWSVEEVNGNGTTTGAVWSFTTESGQQCSLIGDFCTVNADCCSNKCKGKSGSKSCK